MLVQDNNFLRSGNAIKLVLQHFLAFAAFHYDELSGTVVGPSSALALSNQDGSESRFCMYKRQQTQHISSLGEGSSTTRALAHLGADQSHIAHAVRELVHMHQRAAASIEGPGIPSTRLSDATAAGVSPSTAAIVQVRLK